MKLRDQLYKYRSLPDRAYLVKLYRSHTLQEIADLHGTHKPRVRKWFDQLGIPKRPRGAGNHQQYRTDRETITAFIAQGLLNTEIAKILGCGKSNVSRAMKVYGLTANRRQWIKSEFQHFVARVHRKSNKVYELHKEALNPKNHPRTLHGIPGGYQLDHIKSIRECFEAGWTEDQTAEISNLQFISWEANLAKRKFGCASRTI